ncbi:MAG: TonB-dependent receptor [Gammaproteobacteria bacterium]|nr:TonB-dependent receptor [Sideroxydans sp.]MBU3903558.1 TonB-dependent receptor [Gammaproteobacteria bacterium]MBU4044958.1 TonB-dependent receptor [Gammaproteobacteria bacterium]MBU4150681.1 TonB-dependent receptor [Gammaproteobacteria bacterium]
MPALSRRPFWILLATSWIGVAGAQSYEEEDLALAYGDKATISIATGNQQPINRAPAVSTVITAGDIAAMGVTDLDQALESVPGLHVSINNVAMNPIYGFRGIHTRYTPQILMMVNGIPITNVFWGDRSQMWGGMPLENVARIEVIRGPGSALYGADAFSGVINIITKTATDIQGTEVGVRAGSFNTRDAWLQHGGKLGAVDAAFYLRAGSTAGHGGIIQQDAQTTSDTNFGTNASHAPGPLNTERKAVDVRTDLSIDAWRLRAALQDRNVAVGALAGSLDPDGRGHSSRLYLDLSYAQTDWAPDWDVSGVVGYFDNKEDPGDPAYTLFPAGACVGSSTNCFPNGMIGNPGHSERHTHASLSAFYTGFERHRLHLGTGYRVQDLYEVREIKNFNASFAPLPGGLTDVTGDPSLVFMLPHKRNLAYAFVQDEWGFATDWTLTAGVRHDSYSDFGGTTNPRIALVWDAAYNVVVKAMHANAFRAPSFSEQHSINNPVTIGSPNIKPETITTDELAFSWQAARDLQHNLNFFRYRMRDIILPITGSTYQNAGDQTGRGLELESTWDARSNLRLTGSYSLQHSTDAATGQDAGMAPHRRLFARAEWRFAPRWHLSTKINHVTDRMREPGDSRAKVPDYTLVDLTLRREKVAGDWGLSAMVYNLFDRKAWEPTFKSVGMTSDLPLPGRSLYLQLQYNY